MPVQEGPDTSTSAMAHAIALSAKAARSHAEAVWSLPALPRHQLLPTQLQHTLLWRATAMLASPGSDLDHAYGMLRVGAQHANARQDSDTRARCLLRLAQLEGLAGDAPSALLLAQAAQQGTKDTTVWRDAVSVYCRNRFVPPANPCCLGPLASTSTRHGGSSRSNSFGVDIGSGIRCRWVNCTSLGCHFSTRNKLAPPRWRAPTCTAMMKQTCWAFVRVAVAAGLVQRHANSHTWDDAWQLGCHNVGCEHSGATSHGCVTGLRLGVACGTRSRQPAWRSQR